MKKIGKIEVMMAALEAVHDQGVRENEFTVEDFLTTAKANNKGMSARAARESLSRLVKQGKLKIRKAMVNDRLSNVYSAP
jgi:predicted nucleotidyltransferase